MKIKRIPLVSSHRLLTHLAPLLVAALALLPAAAQAQAIEAWVQRYNGPANGWDAAHAVAVDTNGNVLVTGGSYGAGLNMDYVTIKYSSAGVPLWTNRYDGPGSSADEALALAVDSSGDVYTTGYSTGSGSLWDYATIKYSSAGVPLWTNRHGGLANFDDMARALALDADGNVYVTGSSVDSVEDTSGNPDYATIKYSSTGVPLWTNRYDGPGYPEPGWHGDSARAMAVDVSGNVYVTGTSTGSEPSYDYATIAYSSAGVPLWTNRYYKGYAKAVAVDSNGNIYVTGDSEGDSTTIKYSSAGVELWVNRFRGLEVRAMAVETSGNVYVTGSAGFNDFATIAYSSAGVPRWTNHYTGPGTYGTPLAVAVDANGNVHVTGSSEGSVNSYDYLTIAYSGAGVPLWTNRYDGPGNYEDYARSIAVDIKGNVYVTGYSTGSSTGYDFATVKYAPAAPSRPAITNTFLADTNLVFAGNGGTAGGTYYVLTSTDIAAPMASWSRESTNTFPVDGSFSVTNTVDPAKGSQFFRLQVP